MSGTGFLTKAELKRVTGRGTRAGQIAAWCERNQTNDLDLYELAVQQKLQADLASIRRRAAARRAETAARRSARLQRTPPWADLEAISRVYEEAQRLTRETGIEHHVDHFLPLRGRRVSGLHVHNNLRVVPARDNLAKGNRFEDPE